MHPVRLTGGTLGTLHAVFGGELVGPRGGSLARFVPLEHAEAGDLTPFLRSRLAPEAAKAAGRGAALLVAADLAAQARGFATAASSLWLHPYASWAMAKVLASFAVVDARRATLGADTHLGLHVSLGPRVEVGARVTIGASSVVGSPGFGWASGPHGESVQVPQLGGVVIEDDVWVGPLVTLDAGTLAPTILRRGVRLDAHVHVGHNCEIGEGTFVAAQSGFAGSVKIGRGVLVGGQVGVADHVTVGDGARLAAKSGVIGDVPAGAVYAGYPAVPRGRWLRGLALMYRQLRRDDSDP